MFSIRSFFCGVFSDPDSETGGRFGARPSSDNYVTMKQTSSNVVFHQTRWGCTMILNRKIVSLSDSVT